MTLLQAKTRVSGGWRPCGHCRDRADQHGSSLLPMPGAMRAPWDCWGKAYSCSDWELPSSSKRTLPQGLWTMLTNTFRLYIPKSLMFMPFFFNSPISLRNQFVLNISKASFKTALQCFDVFCSGLWSICPPLNVETPLPF